MKKYLHVKLPGVVLGIFCFLFFGTAAHAQTVPRSYHYERITQIMHINADSTFDVEERQIFNYVGGYHQGWRSISLNKIDAVTDIQVIDGATRQALGYSSARLEKTNSASWGKYTHFRHNGAINIEWYYNLADTAHEWILQYKVHGGIGFYKDHDELYWNLFTDYDVPVLVSEAMVFLPNQLDNNQLHAYIFTSSHPEATVARVENGTSYYFSAGLANPKEAVTIVATWPKGIVSQRAYFLDFVKIYWGYLGSLVLILATGIFLFIRWYMTEKLPERHETVVAQYEPPRGLPPAMMEVVLKEKITHRTWPATVVDLAARGYLRIHEEKAGIMEWVVFAGKILPLAVAVFFITYLFVNINNSPTETFPAAMASRLFWVVLLLFLFWRLGLMKDNIFTLPKVYDLERIDLEHDGRTDYEKEFLKIIMWGKYRNSTRALQKASNEKKREMYLGFKNLKRHVYHEVALKTGDYIVSPEMREKRNAILGSSIVGVGVLLAVLHGLGILSTFSPDVWMVYSTVFLCVGVIIAFIKYEPRLSPEGIKLRNEILGFKLYLKTAERYRMQNLTPETFEKYLSYAMIFGVEKKWARAFQILNIPLSQPGWYVGSGGHSFSSASGSASAGGFSASSFSASLSSSFSSAFSSSSGSGGGGGGGAGGRGGGGGGGGAS